MGIMIILVVILMNSAFALGVSPARKLFNYGSEVTTGSLEIVNNQKQELNLMVSDGDISPREAAIKYLKKAGLIKL